MNLPDQAAFYGALPAKRVVAGVLITDDDERVLLLQPSYKPTWEIPGGAADAGESPRAAARRHVAEELGFEPGIGRLLVVDWVPEEPPKTEAIAFIFDGGTLDQHHAAGIRLQRADLNAYGFVDLEGAMGLVSDRLERRVKAALAARRGGRLLELEEGWRQELEPPGRAISAWKGAGR